MTKINPYDLPTEEERSVRIVLKNIEWDVSPQAGVTFPQTISVPVDSNLPEEQMIAKAIDIASSATGFCITDCDVEPIVYSPQDESISDSTLEYVGDIYTNDL
tara:strand:- start:1331 stop:1639 length:309 start_codon:yes stop_codon:yes gene_type:complete